MTTLHKLPNGEYIDPFAVTAIRYGEANEHGHPNRMIVDYGVLNHFNCVIVPVADKAEFDAEAQRLSDSHNTESEADEIYRMLDREGLVRGHGRCPVKSVAALIGEHARLREALAELACASNEQAKSYISSVLEATKPRN